MTDHAAKHVLLVESDESDAKLVCEAFANRSASYQVTHVTNLSAARQFLNAGHRLALIIADWQLPDGRGVDLSAHEARGRAPVILLARNGNERFAVEAIKAGASEYQNKTHAALVGLPAFAENVMREWSAHTDAQADAAMRRLPADSLRAVAELAIDLAGAPAHGDIHQLVTHKVRALTDALAVTISMYDPQASALVLMSLDARPGLVTRANQLLGRNLVGMRVPVAAEQCEWMLSLKGGKPQSLSELSWGAIPAVVGRAIEGVLGLGEINATVLQYEGQMLGTLVVYMPRNADPVPYDLLYAIGHMVSLALRRKSAEERSLDSEVRYRLLVENAPLGILVVATNGQIVDANPAMTAIMGLGSVEEARQVNVLTSSTLVAAGIAADAARCLSTSQPLVADHPYTSRTGLVMHLRYHVRPLFAVSGALDGLQAIVEDMTQYRQIEERLLQAQKMEAVGRLAGGVAHDFNNMLAVIIGNAEMALASLSPDMEAHEELQEIHAAARRSADLTQQLLAFARRQTVAPRVLDLNETVAGMLKMLRRLVGEDIALTWRPGPNLWPVKIDPSQVDQILANLAVNSQDAISGGGRVTIETANVTVGAEECIGRDDLAPGDYVRLTFGDNGCGMSNDTLKQLFEPFFTTKEVGKGTGLGLATVYGIVRQNQGHIRVQSALGEGATFWVYLPRHLSAGEQVVAAAPAPSRGHETILLVEDSLPILRLNKRVLEGLGYTVLAAASPSEALRMAESYPGVIHLLLTDVVMPEMNGRDLAHALMAPMPGIKLLFMSGYTADVIAQHGVLDPGVHFIQKPYSRAELAARVREVLESDRGAASPTAS